MKRGRDLFAAVISAEGGMVTAIAKLKGRDLDALIHYAEGLAEDEGRDEVIGVAVIVAAGRYLAKVRRKAEKELKRARRAF